MRFSRRPADDRFAGFLRQRVRELAAHLLGTDQNDLGSLQSAPAAVDFLRDTLQMLLDELLDVSLVPRLRPTALVMLPERLFIEVLRELVEMAGANAEDVPLLA